MLVVLFVAGKALADEALTVCSLSWIQLPVFKQKRVSELFGLACRHNESCGIVGRLSNGYVVKVTVVKGCCLHFACDHKLKE